MADKLVVWFKDISKDDIAIAGGKGANLGEMFNLGIPVPGGFVVTAQAYKKFIDDTKIRDKILDFLKDLDVEDNDALQLASINIQKLVESTEVPKDIKKAIVDSYKEIGEKIFVAVRSSATAEDLPEASFAGQQATFLNIRGSANIANAVRSCWASLFTARAIYYRTKNNFPHEKVLIAVAVQKMVNSQKSGIMFTANPSTNNLDEVVIEAAWGLGEAVVSGAVNPDLYILDKATLKIKKKELKKQEWGLFRNDKGENEKRLISEEIEALQVLNNDEIIELANYGKKLEAHYGKPQDIEWAVEDKVFIVQTRAITTLKKAAPKAEEEGISETEAKILVKGETASPGIAAGTVKIVVDAKELGKIQKGDVLVTKMTNPDMVPAMQRAGAIVTDEGGLTSHAAIVSREMQIPCIVGTETGTKMLKDGQIVTVDATNGVVYEGKLRLKKEEEKPIIVSAGSEIVTATDVKVIMDLPNFAEKAAATNADGVGLVRLEIMIANAGIHPAQYIRENKDEDYIKMLMDGIGKIAKAFKGKPVWVRTSDFRTDEYKNLRGGELEPKETDPMIGWHAIRRAIDEPRIIKAEFTAVKRLHEQGLKNIGIMIPFVIRVDEIRKAKQMLREVGMEPRKDVEFGVMVETPAICWVIDDACKEGIDFVSFGTNDLTQLTLGIDRNNQKIAHLFDEMHPSVLGEMSMVIRACRKYGVKSSICGQAGSRPEMAEFLVKEGIDSISANPDAVAEIRRVVAHTERKLLIEIERRRMKRVF